jgi:hypothetical protein
VAIRVDAGIVPVAPGEVQGVPANNGNLGKLGILPGYIMMLATVSLAHGAWTPPAQVLKRIPTHVAIIPSDLELVLGCQPPDLDRMLHGYSYSRIETPLHASLC